MTNKNQRYCLAFAGQKLGRMPKREKIAGALLATLLIVIVASSFGGLQAGILVYLAAILTVLASLIYKYAKSTEAMARATVDLGRASRKEALLSMARRISEETIIFNEILEELRKAETTPRPPFELSAWERNGGKLESMKEWTDVDIDAIAFCYRHLSKQNMEVPVWEELQQRLQGLVNIEKRRSISMTLKSLEHENLSVIKPVVSMLAGRLKQ